MTCSLSANKMVKFSQQCLEPCLQSVHMKVATMLCRVEFKKTKSKPNLSLPIVHIMGTLVSATFSSYLMWTMVKKNYP